MASSQGKAFCSICNKEWSRKKTYNEHIRTIHHESYIFSFDSKDYLVVRDGIEHLLCCPLCDVQHENVKNFSHHSRSAHKVLKFSFKAVEGDEEVELEDMFMDVDFPAPDQPVSSPTPKATPLRLPSSGLRSTPLLSPPAQPSTPPCLESPHSSSMDLELRPRPLPTLPTQRITAAEPAMSDLTTTDTLAKYGLMVHRHYSTLHCMACLDTWVPSKVVAHLRSHSFTISREDESQLLHVLRQLHIVSTETALAPKTLGPPVEGLAIHTGFRCNFCTYCTLKKTSMGKHVCKEAPVGSQFGSPFRTATVQTFWSVLHRHYFEVTAPLSTQPDDISLLDIYASKLLPDLTTITHILQPIHPHELPLMVQMTGWHTHLADYLKDRRLVGDLLDLVQLPTRGSGSRLAKLGDVANEYLEIAGRRISKSPFEVRKMLKRYPMESVHFKPLEDSSTILRHFIRLNLICNLTVFGGPVCEQ
ncbi:hypothetical protein PTI98_008300 [Pleurotus ostreatus]|nr:hypothetical protein PTI98_008300 [Pleurotus ostreatus]